MSLFLPSSFFPFLFIFFLFLSFYFLSFFRFSFVFYSPFFFFFIYRVHSHCNVTSTTFFIRLIKIGPGSLFIFYTIRYNFGRVSEFSKDLFTISFISRHKIPLHACTRYVLIDQMIYWRFFCNYQSQCSPILYMVNRTTFETDLRQDECNPRPVERDRFNGWWMLIDFNLNYLVLLRCNAL